MVTPLDEWVRVIHENAKAHGWWDGQRNFGECLALIHSEVSEAMEAWRESEIPKMQVGWKPEGWAVELADVIIRCMDTLAGFAPNLSLQKLMSLKHEFNLTREYRHGGKRA
ncbi:MAG: hypothetical protein ACREQ5_16120 [Candidatus Dormibacteria bacterium]